MRCPFCCEDDFYLMDLSSTSELCDTYGGDYTYRDLYFCQNCGTLFYYYFGNESFVEEINDIKEIETLLNELVLSNEDRKTIKSRYLIS